MKSGESDISITVSKGILSVNLHAEYLSREIEELQQKVGQIVFEKGLKGIIIDLSSLHVIDSRQMREIGDLSRIFSLLGSQTVFTGVRPDVIMAVVELGYDSSHITFCQHYDHGLILLNQQINQRH